MFDEFMLALCSNNSLEDEKTVGYFIAYNFDLQG